MRNVAKLRLFATELDNSINCLEDLLRPSKWNIFIEACKLLGNIQGDVTRASPFNIIHVGQAIVNIAKDLKAVTDIDEVGKVKREMLQAWIDLYSRKFIATIGKRALKVASQKKWQRVDEMPTSEDISKLTEFLRQEIVESMLKIDDQFTYELFGRLNNAVMLHLLIFNRRRIGEVNQFKVDDFLRRQKLSDESDAFNNLSESEKKLVSNFYYVLIKGKWHRAVPLLISNFHNAAIEKILQLREKGGVFAANPYIFGKGKKGLYDVSDSLRRAALECRAIHPERITGTNLRKHLATVSQSLDLSESELRLLTGFLGHTVRTHLEHYRKPSAMLQAAKVSKLLLAFDSGSIGQLKGKKIDDLDVEESNLGSLETDFESADTINAEGTHTQDHPSSSRLTESSPVRRTPTKRKNRFSPKRLTKFTSPIKSPIISGIRSPRSSPKKHIRRKIRWTEEEKTIMLTAFDSNLRNETLPSFQDCYRVRSESSLNRPVQKMKAWVNNEIQRRRRQRRDADDSDDS